MNSTPKKHAIAHITRSQTRFEKRTLGKLFSSAKPINGPHRTTSFPRPPLSICKRKSPFTQYCPGALSTPEVGLFTSPTGDFNTSVPALAVPALAGNATPAAEFGTDVPPTPACVCV